MRKAMELTIKKCEIPIIWIDTSVLINMTKYRLGKAKNSNDFGRESRLFEAIHRKVQMAELICPQADQLEEATHSFGEIQRTQLMLSRGIHMRNRAEIKEVQLHNAMKASVYESRVIEVNYQDAFDCDPVIKDRVH